MSQHKENGAYGDDDSRWNALRERDAAADGHFVYAVRSTGIYCRPHCSCRLARRGAILFFDTAQAAERAGFRACKRCRPDGVPPGREQAQKVERACRILEESDPGLEPLARSLGMSASHFHRLFTRLTGVTPKAYAKARQAGRIRRELGRREHITEAIYEAGYASGGRFYHDAPGVLGMTPGAFRDGGRAARIHFAVGECRLGALLVAASEKGVCAVQLGDDPQRLVETLQQWFPKAELIGGDAAFEKTVAQVAAAVEEPERAGELPLDLRGTLFQMRVWQALRAIPAGKTATYREIAAAIGRPRAVRAVAAACAANRVAVLIPCHRVIRTDGSLSGYRWGVERKRALLLREASRANAR